MLCTAFDLYDVWFVITFKVDETWAEHDSNWRRTSLAALPVVVAAPGKTITITAENYGMLVATFDIDGFLDFVSIHCALD